MTSKKNRLSYSFLMTCNIFVILKVYPADIIKFFPYADNYGLQLPQGSSYPAATASSLVWKGT